MSDEQITDLQKRVKELESFASSYYKRIALQEQLRRERRYALLQAAAQNLPKLVAMSHDVGNVDSDGEVYNYELKQTVAVAEDLLAEIENAEKQS